jgi:Fic family protein
LLDLLADWEKFIHNADDGLPILIKCALLHYQFEAIHPFLDGNGRVGRLLITLFLYEHNALPLPLLYLSAFFDAHRAEYYERLLSVSRDNDWDGWLRFFLRGVITQSNHATDSAAKIIKRREQYRQRLQENKAPASVIALLDHIFINPYVSLNGVKNKLNVSFNTAKNAVAMLVKEGILYEMTGQQRNRLYVATELIDLLVENEKPYQP